MPKLIDNIDTEILELLSQNDSISIHILQQHYPYSVPVLRKICKTLASQYGLTYQRGILRTSLHHYNQEISIEKKMIAQKAVSFIEDGDTIFIGAGTTVATLCPYLHKFQKLTVMTNSLPVLAELLKYPHITTICVGGVIQHQDKALVGEFTDIFTKNFHIHKLFLGTEGIDINKGAFRSVIQKNMAEHIVANLEGEIYLLAESPKFRKKFTWLWLPIKKVYAIVTDSGISPEAKKQLQQSHIHLEIADHYQAQ